MPGVQTSRSVRRRMKNRCVAVEEKRVDVALAEFNALRSELLSYSTAQSALVGVGLTTLAVIVGFVVKEDGDPRLLLAIPPLATVINLLQAANTYRMGTIGKYIQVDLWPYLQRTVKDEQHLPNWEKDVAKRMSTLKTGLPALLVNSTPIILFTAASAVALTEAGHLNHGLRDLGWVLAAGSVLVPLLLAVVPALLRKPPKGLCLTA